MNKIVVLKKEKGKDKRDVLKLSTKHDTSTTTYQHREEEVTKPTMIADYKMPALC